MMLRLNFPMAALATLFFASCSEEPAPPKKRPSVAEQAEKEKVAKKPAEKPTEKPAEKPQPPPETKANPDLDPSNPIFKQPAPAEFRVRFTTTRGDFDINVTRDWAPQGADRFYALVKSGFFDDCRFFRVVPNFMVQFGINGDPKISAKFMESKIPDDPVKQSNTRGMVTFAKQNQPNTRGTQVFINFKDQNAFLDKDGFAPFGRVTAGMEVVDAINAEYRESPNQGLIQSRGNEYLDGQFPKLDKVKSARVLE